MFYWEWEQIPAMSFMVRTDPLVLPEIHVEKLSRMVRGTGFEPVTPCV